MVKPTITEKDIKRADTIHLANLSEKFITGNGPMMKGSRIIASKWNTEDKWYLNTNWWQTTNKPPHRGYFSESYIRKYFNDIMDKWDQENEVERYELHLSKHVISRVSGRREIIERPIKRIKKGKNNNRHLLEL